MTRARAALAASLLAASSLAGARAAAAQGGATCTVTPATLSGADACQKARDLFAFVVPQVGVAVSGGNPIPGDAGTLGGLGKVAVSLRVIAVEGRLPKNQVPINVTSGTGTSSDFGAARTIMPLPAIDVGVGLFPGVPFGVTNVGGVDLLVGATMLPTIDKEDFALAPKNGGLSLSYGLRVGALQESSLVPGLSVSWQRRALPETDFSYTPGNDTLIVDGTSVRSDAIRIVASKRFALFGVAAGVGQDRIEGTSSMRAVVNEGNGVRGTVKLNGLRETTNRKTAFVNASLSLLLFRVVGEYGWSSAGTMRQTVNTFGGRDANEGYRYGSIGLTARF